MSPSNRDPLLADLADDNDENGLGDGLGDGLEDDNEGGAPAAPAMPPSSSTARPAPSEDDDEGYTSEAQQRAAEGKLALPPPDVSNLSALPLDELLRALVNATKPKRRTRGLNADALLRSKQIDRIAAKLASTEKNLAALEARRADVDVLDDRALNIFQRQLADAESTIKTLRMAHTAHVDIHERESAEEARQALETSTRTTIANHAAQYAAGLQELHFYAAQIVALGVTLDDHRQAMEGASNVARERGQPELAFDPEILRRAVCRLFETEAQAAVMPERWGETDEQWHKRLFQTLQSHAEGRIRGDDRDQRNLRQDRPRIERAKKLYVERGDDEDETAYGLRQLAHLAEQLPCRQAEGESDSDHTARLLGILAKTLGITRQGESDSAYLLRVGNAHAMAADRIGDVLDTTGQKAVPVIEAHCSSSTTAERLRRQRGHQRLVGELDPRAGGQKVSVHSRMTVAPPPRALPPSQPLPSWVDDVARFGD
ncbi:MULTISPECIES: hypothetical protein [unclassified Mesorhizobium]|uniref:hypothetical protein n=1 Tax=unclassified Mesorhizobium TaxID=325217 RepID=UPI000F7508A1|nr:MULTISPECIES: hypothetical protein [unclassified Mesorhizobium]AZO75352.1 hypothetical protein EJ067_32380 [Mesorhizobium sp. M1D.F.Ca.ET.043.01.1.1]RWA87674.1 MAG: hypothetical protein EOQ32_24010 [Mesorhizobium sp.]